MLTGILSDFVSRELYTGKPYWRQYISCQLLSKQTRKTLAAPHALDIRSMRSLSMLLPLYPKIIRQILQNIFFYFANSCSTSIVPLVEDISFDFKHFKVHQAPLDSIECWTDPSSYIEPIGKKYTSLSTFAIRSRFCNTLTAFYVYKTIRERLLSQVEIGPPKRFAAAPRLKSCCSIQY